MKLVSCKKNFLVLFLSLSAMACNSESENKKSTTYPNPGTSVENSSNPETNSEKKSEGKPESKIEEKPQTQNNEFGKTSDSSTNPVTNPETNSTPTPPSSNEVTTNPTNTDSTKSDNQSGYIPDPSQLPPAPPSAEPSTHDNNGQGGTVTPPVDAKPPVAGESTEPKAPVADNSDAKPPVAGESTEPKAPVADNSDAKPPVADESTEPKAPVADNSDAKPPVADESTEPKAPVADNSDAKPPVADESTEPKAPVADNSDAKPPVADESTEPKAPVADNSDAKPPVADESTEPKAPVADNSDAKPPVADESTEPKAPVADNSDAKPPVADESTEPKAPVADNSDAKPPVADESTEPKAPVADNSDAAKVDPQDSTTPPSEQEQGRNIEPKPPVAAPTKSMLAYGNSHMIVTESDGTLTMLNVLWDEKGESKLDLNSASTINLKKITSVSIIEGDNAIAADGNIYVWKKTDPTPKQLVATNLPKNFRSVHLGSQYNSAITEDGRLFSWPHNFAGKTPPVTSFQFALPVSIVSAASDKNYFLAASEGNLFAWQKSLSPMYKAPRIDTVETDLRFKSVATAFGRSAVITTAGKLYIFDNLNIGTAKKEKFRMADREIHLGNVDSVILLEKYTVALTTDGRVFYWENKLPRPNFVEMPLPSGVTAASIAAGEKVIIAIGNDGKIHHFNPNK